jgi:membrane-associated protein
MNSPLGSLAGLLPWFLKYGYFALFSLLFLGGIYLPLPSNLALLGAGILSHITDQGLHFNFFIAAGVAFTASILGDTGAYYLSRRFTSKKRRAKFEKGHPTYVKLESYLRRHPVWTVGVSRMIGFLSPAVNSLAGFSKLPVRIFLTGDIIGNAFTVLIYMLVGYEAQSVSGNLVELLGFATSGLLVLAVIYIAAIVFLRRK